MPDLLSAVLSGDESAATRARGAALARPGDSLDALTRVAVVLAGNPEGALAAVAALSVMLDLALVRPADGGRRHGQ